MNDLYHQIKAYQPFNEQEENDKKLFLQWLDSKQDIYTRKNEVAHLTASAWVVSPNRKQVLMVYHNLYNSWSWMGGHADGERDLLAVTYREVAEESGLSNLKLLSPNIYSLETLCVDGHEKKGNYVSSHLHLNITYLFEANPEDPIRIKEDENSDIGWIAIDDIANVCSEPWFVQRIYSKLITKLKDY
ncbi:MAG: NUDIX hydrolase [Erysipelotrichaceae bacterium]|nr:NUDIX hydrolase [Erysipelotrichaceae bacterium]